jgi:hypothetical protein
MCMGVFPAYCLCATCMLGAHRGVSEAVNFPSGRAAISSALPLFLSQCPDPGGDASVRWLPGGRARAAHSLVEIAGIKIVAFRSPEAPPDSAGAAGLDLFLDPPYSPVPGGLQGSWPWLWPLVGRGHGPPHAGPGASISAWLQTIPIKQKE